MQVPSAPQIVKREQSNQFFQQQAFKPFIETDLSRQHVTQTSSIQVPLQTIPQVHIAENIISSQANHPQSSSNTFKVPGQVSNISASVGNMYQSNLAKQNTPVSYTDSPAFRRHSYTTGQHVNQFLRVLVTTWDLEEVDL
ncbi:MLX-interacting protein [Caerostris extrusa]|uniref:MLX-interacting protein n=1 Tax=Caerostris extrusa TaxID=172846 RepID=A0AAV4SEB7_CAEEX|nr:MLX-interacting protein [Caerostris extrusa]